MQHYPDAKVVLTVREPDRWYDSAYHTIYYVKQAFPTWITPLFPRMRVFRRMLDRVIWDGTFHGRFEDRSFAIEVFNRHNQQVRDLIPPERLLLFEVREDWEPLCAFLDVPVPAGKPFPHLNDAAELGAGIVRSVRIIRSVSVTIVALAVLILVWVTSRFLR
jgi:Sulfotransferase domain